MPFLLIVIVLVLTLSTRSFTVSSTSMSPTLTQGEFLMVSKWYFTPTRGDIVAFALPRDPSTSYVFRLVGMPGERIQMIGGHLHINGQPVRRTPIENYIHDGKPVTQWRETLPNGVAHRTLDMIENAYYDNTQIYDVPEGHYFVMGDNRDNASDSRVPRTGTVPRENLIGFVFYCARRNCN